MKTSLRIFLLLFLLHGQSSSFAQLSLVNEPDKPSAQASEMTKYGRFNPQLYSGRLSLNIPIYVYRDADFTIPISLSYNYNGLVVNKQSGVAGLGWVLECGGYITREVFGIPDESIGEYHSSVLPGGTISYQPLNGFDSLFTNISPFTYPEYIYNIHSPGDVPKMIWFLHRNGKTVYYESSPDIYHFNFLGRSGSFVRNMDGTFSAFHTNTFDGDYHIEKTSAYLGQNGDLSSEITITTSDGFIYVFGDITPSGYMDYTERSVSSGSGAKGDAGGEEKTQTISFLLKEIHAPNDRVVYFKYNEKGEHSEIKSFSPNLWHYISSSANYVVRSNESVSTISYLSSIDIDGGGGVIFFDYSERTGAESGSYVTASGRRSLQGWESFLLDSIQTPVGTTRLEYEYNSVGSRYPFLSRIRQEGIGDYSFSYEGTSDKFFPAQGTTAKDHWGYYNTTDSTTANENYIYLSDISSLTGYEETLQSRDNSNFGAASLGIVREMVYPYGGKTIFRWEANDFSRRVKKEASDLYRPILGYSQAGEITSAPGVRIRSYTNYDENGLAKDSTWFSYTQPGSFSSSGILTVYPRYRISYGGTVGNFPVTVQYAYSGGLTRYDAVPVEYSHVTEHHPDGSKTVHEFSCYSDTGDDFPADADAERTERYVDGYNNTYHAFLNVSGGLERIWNILCPPISHQHQRGKEIGSQVFNSSGTLLAESSSIFNLDEQREALMQYLYVGDAFMLTQRILAADLLKKTTSTTYFQNNSSVSSQVQYTYNSLGQKSSEVKSLSNGDIITTNYTYIPDIADNHRTAVQKKMYSKGLIGNPVKVTVKCRQHGTTIDRVMSSDSLTFDSLARTGATTLFLPKKWQKRDVETGAWKDYASYIHDNKGNIIQKTDANGISTAFIWYSDNMGVAIRIDNATAAQVTSALGYSPFGGIQVSNTESIAATLRNTLTQSEVSWYKWLSYGLPSKVCDPTGRITHYTYDTAQRLNIILDDSLDPVERYDYQTLTR